MKKPLDYFLKFITYIATGITFLTFIYILIYITYKGVPNLTFSLFSLNYTSENASIMPSLVATLILIVISLLIALPLGVGSAIYLVEYANKKNKLVKVVSLTSETLAGVPSIVYGLFGMLFFVTKLRLGFSIISGALTLSIMILPLIMRTTENALKNVPLNYREGAYGLGAGKLRTIFAVVLPAAIPGILAGVILAIGRIVGESAALIYTAGTVAKMPKSLLSSARSLSVHVYSLSSEGLHTDKAYASAFILLLIIILINFLANILANRLKRG